MKEITDKDFETEVLKSEVPVIVDFWADWCAPCQAMGPIFEEVSKKFEGKVKFLKVNVDENPHIASQYNIMSIPTLIIFKDGKPQEALTGVQKKEELEKKLEIYLK